MPTTWTSLSKASATGWTAVNKPPTTSILTAIGEPIGLLLALTYTESTFVPLNTWTSVVVGSTSWTSVPKAD